MVDGSLPLPQSITDVGVWVVIEGGDDDGDSTGSGSNDGNCGCGDCGGGGVDGNHRSSPFSASLLRLTVICSPSSKHMVCSPVNSVKPEMVP